MSTEETAKKVARSYGFIEGTQNFNVVVKIFCEGAEYQDKLTPPTPLQPIKDWEEVEKEYNEHEKFQSFIGSKYLFQWLKQHYTLPSNSRSSTEQE